MRKIYFVYQLLFVQLNGHIIVFYLPVREKILPEHLRDMLKIMYMKLYSPELVQHVPVRYEQITQLEVFGRIHISPKYRSSKSRAIMAIWPGLNGAILDRECNTKDVKIGIIEYLISYTKDCWYS